MGERGCMMPSARARDECADVVDVLRGRAIARTAVGEDGGVIGAGASQKRGAAIASSAQQLVLRKRSPELTEALHDVA